MYTEHFQSKKLHSHSHLRQIFNDVAPASALPIHRPTRPKLITEEEPTTLDQEQRLSAQIVAQGEPAAVAVAARTIHPSISAPLLQNDHSDDSSQITLSPAAMFLSAFSPPSTASVPSSLPDDEGETVAGYTLNGIIGYGGFSIIRRAYSSSGGVVAVKIVRNSDLMKQGQGQGKSTNTSAARRRIDHETRVWSTLCHEHILPLFTSVHTSYADFFVTLLCPCGSLFDILKRDGRPALPQDDAGMMFRQVVRGLRYLHEVAGYVHRDMKLENVLVDEMGTCKIGDFGMARKIGEVLEEDVEEEDEEGEGEVPVMGGVHRAASVSQPTAPPIVTPRRTGLGGMPLHHSLRLPRQRTATSTVHTHPPMSVKLIQPGSLPYAAPELLGPSSDSGIRPPDPAQDMWALGVMLYALLTGRLPFVDSFEPRLQMKILHAVYDIPHGIGSGTERILQGCLDRSIMTRWSVAMVDEVAWGVGWGTENVDVASDEELRCQTATATATATTGTTPATPQSRSRSRVGVGVGVADIHVPESPRSWDHANTRKGASADVASRRSMSRTRRSLSRAPVLTDEVSVERNVERAGRRVGRGLVVSGVSSTSTSSSSSSASEVSSPSSYGHAGDGDGDAYGFVVERGRSLRKSVAVTTNPSRSPSPGFVLLKTPVDDTGFSSPPPLQEDVDDGDGEDQDQDQDQDPDLEAHTHTQMTNVRASATPSLRSSSKSQSKSGIQTSTSNSNNNTVARAREGDLGAYHPDDPRHRVFSISASPRSDLGVGVGVGVGLEGDGVGEGEGSVGEDWGSSGSDGVPTAEDGDGDGDGGETELSPSTSFGENAAAAFMMQLQLQRPGTLGTLAQSRSCESDKRPRAFEEWGCRSRQHGSKTRAGSVPPASGDVGSWRFATSSSRSHSRGRNGTTSNNNDNYDDDSNGGVTIGLLTSAAVNIPGRSRSVDPLSFTSAHNLKPRFGV